MPADVKITTELLYRAALLFALIDAVYVAVLAWRVDETTFQRLKWLLIVFAAIVWSSIWGWAIGNFWDTVYVYVFPPWAQTWVPWIAFACAGLISFGLWRLAILVKGSSVLIFCLSGGILGILTHIWAVYRGIVSQPPMLQGASPLAAVIFAFFEYILYWCTILAAAKIADWIHTLLSTKMVRPSLTGGSHPR